MAVPPIPIAKGMMTLKSRDPIPTVNGSYKPRYNSTDDELRPGMIRLSPQITPDIR